MHLTHLYLKNFRCFQEQTYTFSPDVNLITGENARGKTTLIEAIHLLITGRSFRTHSLQELVRFGCDSFYIEGHFEKNGVQQVLKIHYGEQSKKIWHHDTQLPSFSALFGILNGVTLVPEDHLLIRSGPKLRRLFLDLHLSQVSPLYLYHLRRYTGALKQRNALLKQKKVATIDIWEHQMSLSAQAIQTQRTQLVDALNEKLASSPFEPLSLAYHPGCREDLEAQLIRYRTRDLLLKTTSVGPHKDDFSLSINEKPVKQFASEGQKRSALTALKLAGWKLLAEQAYSLPLLAIDDLSVSFDSKREKALIDHLENGYGQLFLTTPQARASLSRGIQLTLPPLLSEDKSDALIPHTP